MGGNIGTLSITFKADDSEVQATINKILSTIKGVQSGVQNSVNKPLSNMAKQVKSTANSINKSTSKMNTGFSRIISFGKTLGKIAIASFFIKQLVRIGKNLFELGSQMTEVENLFQVSFGNMASQADNFANMLNRAWGVDPTNVKESSAYLNAMFKSMKFGENTAYTMSTELTKLSYNLSSLYNISQKDMFKKLQSGMAGQTRPLRSLGISIDDATIKQYALDKGIVSSTKNMTQQQKTLARYEAIIDQTKTAWQETASASTNGGKAIGDMSKTLKIVGVYKSGELTNVRCALLISMC